MTITIGLLDRLSKWAGLLALVVPGALAQVPGNSNSDQVSAHRASASAAGFSIGSWNNTPGHSPAGTEHHTYFSDCMKVEVGYNIYFPPQYAAQKDARFPVVYWLHGLGGNENSDLHLVAVLDQAIRAGRMRPMLLVLVNGGTRSRYCDAVTGAVKAETTIVRELIPHVDQRWRTLGFGPGRAIQGVSMGGQGALRLAFKYPELFGSVFAFAPALLDGKGMLALDSALIDALFDGDASKFDKATAFAIARENTTRIRGLPITMVCGTADPLLPRNEAMHQELTDLSVGHDFMRVEGVAHSLEDLLDALGPSNFEFASRHFASHFSAGEAAPGPIRVSENGRYFVDAQGVPFYFLADTQWELFRRYSLSEARLILENRKAKGFTVVMVMLTGVGDGTGPNLDGDHPWLNDNPATPNPAYFTNVDRVVQLAQANDIHLLIGIYHQTYGNRITVNNAKQWAAWVTSRYRNAPNIIWTLYPKASNSYRALVSKLAEGIQEGDQGRHLVSMHPDPSPASSSFMHAEPWLGFNSIQVWNQLSSVYPMTLADYNLKPSKPATMLEGVYEAGEEYGYPITPLLVRREAYYTCLAGGFPGYGHNDSWRVKPRWRAALDDPGAQQMTVLKQIFLSLPEWWTLVPDQSVLAKGGNTTGDVLNLGARSAAGKWIIAYVANQPNIALDLTKLDAGGATARWFDPVTGAQRMVGSFSVAGVRSFTRPADLEDGVLVVNAAKDW